MFQDSYYIFGASAAAAGMVLLSAGEPVGHNGINSIFNVEDTHDNYS